MLKKIIISSLYSTTRQYKRITQAIKHYLLDSRRYLRSATRESTLKTCTIRFFWGVSNYLMNGTLMKIPPKMQLSMVRSHSIDYHQAYTDPMMKSLISPRKLQTSDD